MLILSFLPVQLSPPPLPPPSQPLTPAPVLANVCSYWCGFNLHLSRRGVAGCFDLVFTVIAFDLAGALGQIHCPSDDTRLHVLIVLFILQCF